MREPAEYQELAAREIAAYWDDGNDAQWHLYLGTISCARRAAGLALLDFLADIKAEVLKLFRRR